MEKMHVHPMSLGPNRAQHIEIFTAFYSLGCLAAYAKVHRDGALTEAFEFGPVTPTAARDIGAALTALPGGPGIFLLSSYVWNHAENMQFARAVKEQRPGSLVIVGGPHIPRAQKHCERFLACYPYIDAAVRHEGEQTLAEMLDEVVRSHVEPADFGTVDFSSVPGLTFRHNGCLVRTPDRSRTLEISIYPSPYTTGEFDHWVDDKLYIPLETNRGCPYGCTFCDWGAATLSKIARMSEDRIFGEIEYAARHRVNTIGFCDANFGILPRDVDIVHHIIDVKNRYGFPVGVGYTNAKTANPRLTEIIKLLHDAGLTSTGQISMQTTDQGVLDNVARTNIRMSEYRKIIAFFHQQEIPAVSDIMLGLPGQTFEICRRDLQFCFDHKVGATIFATSVMPNAPMADEAYQQSFKIVVGEDGFVESTYSFTREEYAEMFDLCLGYKLLVKQSLLKYLLYFAQIEYGVKAIDVIARWVKKSVTAPEQYPISARIRRDLLERDYRGGLKDWLMLVWGDQQAAFLFDAFECFQREMLDFYQREFGVRLEGTAVEAVMTANREVMPRKGRQLPASIPLTHDVPGYFAEVRRMACLDEISTDHVALADRGPGALELRPQPQTTSYRHADLGGLDLLGIVELRSNLLI